MTDMTKLQLQIDELVASKTFSLDALEGIRLIRDGLREMTEKNAELQRKCEELQRNNFKLSTEIDNLNTRNKIFAEDLEKARKLSSEGQLAIHASKTSAAVADAYKDILYTIFKPSSVRETIQRQVAKPVEGSPGGNGYPPSSGFLATGNETETTVRSEE